MVWYANDCTSAASVLGKALRRDFNISCATPPSQKSSPLCSPVLPSDHQEAKALLLTLLSQGRLPNMPSGFPFHHMGDHSAFGSSLPYEFHQELSPPPFWESSHWVNQTATFTFSAANSQFVWRIALPTVSSYSKHSLASRKSTPTIVADVRMDSTMEHKADYSWYYELVASQPHIISKALATSLEYGVQMVIHLADSNFICQLKSAIPQIRTVSKGDIVYSGVNTDGEMQILYVIEPKTRQTKYSASSLSTM